MCETSIHDGPLQAPRRELPHDGLLRGVELLRGALPHHLARVQEDQPVHRAADGRVLMRHHDVTRHAPLLLLFPFGPIAFLLRARVVHVPHQVLHDRGRHGVQSRGRLIVHHHFLQRVFRIDNLAVPLGVDAVDALFNDGARERGALLHAAAELRRVPVLHAGEADGIQTRFDQLLDLRVGQVAVLVELEPDVFADGERVEERRRLKHHPDFQTRILLVAQQSLPRNAADDHLTLVRREQTRHDAQHRALARP
mmetsp:Transcript_958/g.4066  ORF Transcript_958/g.4066 Transcript_958/m.4066 type:complete len:253 (+) Transcript_958:1350-2108(+)